MNYWGVRVKVCGITSLDDAMMAVGSGADAIGFVFAESPRQIGFAEAAKIAAQLPPYAVCVGVFVNEPLSTISQCLETFLDYAQLHGEESPVECEALSHVVHGAGRIIKVFRVADSVDLEMVKRYRFVCAYHLDTRVRHVKGGSGTTFNWDVAKKVVDLGKPVILAGGLTPENVEEAVRTVRPYAGDASSGVEKSPGKKDERKVKEFIKRAKMCAAG